MLNKISEILGSLHYKPLLQLLEDNIKKMESEISELKEKISCLQAAVEEDKEIEYWNNKYPKVVRYYLRHETDGDYQIDVRNFLMVHDENIPVVDGKDDNEKALNALKWVINNITYAPDKTVYGYDEYWCFPYQTLKRRKGDCEDMSILLYCIMAKSGIKEDYIRLTAGDVNYNDKIIGHAYLTYFCKGTSKWVLLDCCFYPDAETNPNRREDYKDNRIYGSVWFSWNRFSSWSKGTKVENYA